MYAKLILIAILLIGACQNQDQVNQGLINSIFNTSAGLPDTSTGAKTMSMAENKDHGYQSLINSIFDTSAGLPDTSTGGKTMIMDDNRKQFYQSLINSIFDTSAGLPKTTTGPSILVASTKPPPVLQTESSYLPCGADNEKVCVRQYLCPNDDIIDNGATIFDVRIYDEDDGDDKKCNFLEKCCATGDRDKLANLKLPVTPNHDKSDHDKSESCGFRNKNGLVLKIKEVNNNEAEFGEFPWMVAIMQKQTLALKSAVIVYKCGGSLIALNVVMTAAHCVYDMPAHELITRAGEWESNSNAEPFAHQDRQVKEIVVHENFNRANLYNDMALLYLEAEFDEAPHINTICLPPVGANFDTSRCFATGWGKTLFQNGKYANILKKIDLPVVPNAKCQRDLRKTRLSKYFKLHHSFMCAGGEPNKDTCKGDGGSPLVCPMTTDPDRYFQVGIVAWGIGCGGENVPGVYANVPTLRSWIDDELAYKKANETPSFE